MQEMLRRETARTRVPRQCAIAMVGAHVADAGTRRSARAPSSCAARLYAPESEGVLGSCIELATRPAEMEEMERSLGCVPLSQPSCCQTLIPVPALAVLCSPVSPLLFHLPPRGCRLTRYAHFFFFSPLTVPVATGTTAQAPGS